jgi:hypothetical protein
VIQKVKAFLLGVYEFQLTLTTSVEEREAYDLGREWAHKLTFRHFEPY